MELAQATSLAVLVMNPIVVTFFLSAVAAVSGDSSPYEYEQSYTPETHQYTSGKLDIDKYFKYIFNSYRLLYDCTLFREVTICMNQTDESCPNYCNIKIEIEF